MPYPRLLASAGRALEFEEAERAEPAAFGRFAAGLGACLAWPEKLYRLPALAATGSRFDEAVRAPARGAAADRFAVFAFGAGLAAELPIALAPLPCVLL